MPYPQPSRATRIGATLTCLLTSLLLSGCSAPPQLHSRGSPEAYTEPTDEPVLVAASPLGILTNGELAQHVLALRDALRSCNADKASTAEYNQSLKKE